jgi:hypothetical protein
MTILRLYGVAVLLAGAVAYFIFGEMPRHFNQAEWLVIAGLLLLATIRLGWFAVAMTLTLRRQEKETPAIEALDLRSKEVKVPEKVETATTEEPSQAEPTPTDPGDDPPTATSPKKRVRRGPKASTTITTVMIATSSPDPGQTAEPPPVEKPPRLRVRNPNARGQFGKRAPPKAPEPPAITH